MTTSVSLITYAKLPELDPDDRLLSEALKAKGIDARPAVWNDSQIDWRQAGICILRSTWDYHEHYQEFLEWVGQVSVHTSLINPEELIVWNSRKTYLKDLQEKGIPIVPTVFVEQNNKKSLREILAQEGWDKAVIKPAVGLSTSGVITVSVTDAENLEQGEEHLRHLTTSDTALVQPYMKAVSEYGERALIFLDGVYSHAIKKAPFQKMAVAGKAGETKASASDAELAAANKILSVLDQTPLYSRIDLIPDENGTPLLMELELVEPSLFLRFSPEAADKFAEIIVNRVQLMA